MCDYIFWNLSVFVPARCIHLQTYRALRVNLKHGAYVNLSNSQLIFDIMRGGYWRRRTKFTSFGKFRIG